MKGIYILVIELPVDAEINTKRRKFALSKGFYLYVGSAMNNMEARIKRHLSKSKKQHWHIDFLLDRARIKAVFLAQTEAKQECQLASQFARLQSTHNFGCSDCRCFSHLFFGDSENALRSSALQGFKAIGLEPLEHTI
ncbi:MAG: GIY-YIG nuclease family protein [Dehalogenimonas sp.]